MKHFLLLLIFFCNNVKAQVSKTDSIELKQLITSLTDCFDYIKGDKTSDTLNIISFRSNVILKNTFHNSINVGKDSTYRNSYTPCSYSAIISDSLSENEAKLLVRKWKKSLHATLENEQSVLYSNDYGFDFLPLNISYSLRKDNIELMVYRTQYEDRKYWIVGLYLAKRY